MSDRCPQNPTYNKNEFSYGLGGASIVDYLIAEGDAVNQPDVQSGSTIELYIRVRYDRTVEHPLVGFTLKTRDGTLAFGTHSGWLQQELSPGEPGKLATYKVTVRMDLGADDWFMDLSVAANQAEILHTREAVVHLRTISSMVSTGFAALQTRISEIK